MIQELITFFGSELDLTPEEVADLFWLILERQKHSQTVDYANIIAQENTSVTMKSSSTEQSINTNIAEEDLAIAEIESSSVNIYTSPPRTSLPTTQEGYVPISVPDAPSVRKPLDFIRALQSLSRKVPSSTEKVINERATVDWIAQTDIWMPILQPEPKLWLELALVIDESDSMILWRHTVKELQQILKHYGIFRDVRVWGMGKDNSDRVYLRSQTRSCSYKELIDPQNRRLIMLVSDFTDDLWRNLQTISILADWTESNPVVLLQMLPPWMWSRTALGSHTPAQFRSNGESILNPKLMVTVNRLAKRCNHDQGINLPLITLESELAKNWSRVIARYSLVSIPGYVLRKDLLAAAEAASSSQTITARERVSNFNVNASPLARELASLLAAAPVITMPVVRLIISAILAPPKRDGFTQLQVAEVFLGGLLKPTVEITRETEPEQVQYEFIDGVRKELLKSTPLPKSKKIFFEVSRYLAERWGKNLQEFFAWVREPSRSEDREPTGVKPFAKVASEILPQLGYQFDPNPEGIEQFEPEGVETKELAAKAVRELHELAGKLREKKEVEASDEALRKANSSVLIDNEKLKLAWLLAATAEADPSSGDEKLKQALNILKYLNDSSPNFQNQAKDRSDQLNQVKAFVYFQAGELNDDNSNFPEDSQNYYNQAYKALKDGNLNTYKTDIETNLENVETKTLLSEQDVVNIYSLLIRSSNIDISSLDEKCRIFQKIPL